MSRLAAVYRSTIGKKYVMAITAIFLFLFVVGHLVGNLKIFVGDQAFTDYAVFLRHIGSPIFPERSLLWLARIGLIAAVVWHIVAYIQLWRGTRAARRKGYESFDPQVFSFASRTMAWGGITIFLFVIFHLMDLTLGVDQVNPYFVHDRPFVNVVYSLQRWPVALFYMAGVIALGLHLYHGLWSALQTLGVNSPRINEFRRPLALWISVIITLGYLSIPVAVLGGWVQ